MGFVQGVGKSDADILFRNLHRIGIHGGKITHGRDFVGLGFIVFYPNCFAIIGKFDFRRLFAAVDGFNGEIVYQLVTGVIPLHIEFSSVLLGIEHFFDLGILGHIRSVYGTFEALFGIIRSTGGAHTFQINLVMLLAGVKLKGKIGVFSFGVLNDLFYIYRNIISSA